MTKFHTAAALIFGVLFAGQAVAQQVIECKPYTGNSKGWIPQFVAFGTMADGSILVADPITMHSTGTAARAQVLRDTDTRTEFKWRTGRLRDNTMQEAEFVYSATYLKRKKMLVIYAKPLGYHNDFSGRGPCVVSNRKLKIPRG